MEYKDLSDDELVERARSDDMDAMDQLFKRYDAMVKSRASNYYIKGGDKDDVIQEGRIGFLMAVMNYTPGTGNKFSSYAYSCVTNSIINAVTKGGALKNVPLNSYVSIYGEGQDSTEGENADSSGAVNIPDEKSRSPEDIVMSRQIIDEKVESILSRLSAREKSVFRLYMQEMDYHQIAETLGISPRSAVNALTRIKNKFRKDSN